MFLNAQFLNTKRIGIVVLSGFLAACNSESDDKNVSQDPGQATLTDQAVNVNKIGTIDPSGDAESTSSPEESKQISIQGGAIKGVIENGVVRVFSVKSKAGFYGKSKIPLGAAERTDENGQFNITIPGKSVDTIVVEITADINTRMTCDVVDGCGLDAQGEFIVFGKKFPLNSDFILEAAYSGLHDKEALTLYVTPLTHLAVSHAVAQTDGLSADNISTAYSLVEENLNLSPGSLQLPPPDLTRLDTYDSLSGDELQYAVMSASFLAMVNMPDWGSIDEVINSAADRFALSGSLPNENGGAVSEVTLDDLFYQASDIAGDLQSTTTKNGIIVELVSVESSTEMYYQEVSSLYSDPNTEAPVEEVPVAVTPVEEAPVEEAPVVVVPVEEAPVEEAPVKEAPVVDAPEDDVAQPLKIISHPSSVVVSVNDAVLLDVGIEGGGNDVSFQWRLDGDDIAGANTHAFAIAAAQVSDEGGYNVVIKSATDQLNSQVAILSVMEPVQPVSITSQPDSIDVLVSGDIEFQVSVTGGGLIAYQWRKDGVDIEGENGRSLLIDGVQVSDEGAYNVLVSNSVGQTLSGVAILSVSEPVQPVIITSHPGSIAAIVNDSVELLVGAEGGGSISYQWRKDNINIEGANQSVLLIKSVELSDAGVYDVIVTNDVGMVPSLAATLSVDAEFTALLSWMRPTKRQDGTDLLEGDEAGYVLSYGTQSDHMSEIFISTSELVINDNQERTYEFKGLEPDKIYYFKIATVDASGIQGEFSEAVPKSTKTVL